MAQDQAKLLMLLNLIKHQRTYIDEKHLYAKDPFKSKYQLLINGRKKLGIKKLKYLKTFIDDSRTTDKNAYEN